MSIITSFSNPTIKAIRKLTEHKERAKTGLFFAEGLRIVGEALEYAMVESLVIAPDLLISEYGQSLVQIAHDRSINIVEVSSEVFSTLSAKDGPQGIAAVLKQNWHNLQAVYPQPGEIWVALESVQNPGNLGSIMRTTEAIGGSGMILLDQSTDPYDSSAVKASMGALFSLKLVRSDFNEFSGWIMDRTVSIIGSSDRAAQDYLDLDYPDPCILLMGSERQGLPEKYLNLCRSVVRIPMQGRSDSLNLAIAASIILYQVYNQRRRNL